MRYTNKYNLPDYVCEWLMVDEYDHDPDAISATGLLKPPRMTALERMFPDELEIDVSDLIASRIGTAIHNSFETVKLGEIQERRLETTLFGVRITGKMDIIRNSIVRDVKTTSVWKYIYGEHDEYIKQLSIYRWLCRENGIEIANHGEICFVFTDWKASDARRDASYPQCKIQAVPISLWEPEDTVLFVSERAGKIIEALNCEKPEELPYCTDEELWKGDDVWAIMHPKRKRARKLCKSEAEAKNCINDGEYIEFRRGQARRCNYCACRKVCEQYKTLEKKGLIAPK